MFTIRNLGGVALFLFGTTYLWLTPAFAGRDVVAKGTLWSVTQVLALVTLVGFTIATWGLFTRTEWWEPLAIGSAVLGLVTLVPYWLAAHGGGEGEAWFHVFIHALGCAGVLLLLLLPSLEKWVSGHVTAGA